MSPDTESLNILIAEDDPDDQLLLRDAFRQARVADDVTIVCDGSELLEYLRAHRSPKEGGRPDLVLLDLNMPRVDGREALASIKADSDLCSIPVVVLTTSSDEGDILKCYALGANSYICKPDSFSDLVDIVAHLHRYWFQMVELPTRVGRRAT
jgi:two-component system response regulator